jgi:hypothetical protein
MANHFPRNWRIGIVLSIRAAEKLQIPVCLAAISPLGLINGWCF